MSDFSHLSTRELHEELDHTRTELEEATADLKATAEMARAVADLLDQKRLGLTDTSGMIDLAGTLEDEEIRNESVDLAKAEMSKKLQDLQSFVGEVVSLAGQMTAKEDKVLSLVAKGEALAAELDRRT